MRIVMVSKACVVGQYQTKLEEIAKHRDVELTVVVPPFWRDERGTIALERAHTRGYTLLVEPMWLNGQFHFHFYPTLPEILKRARPDIVHIDEEPYNLATFLAMQAAQQVGAKKIFFTWQNILGRYPPPFNWMEKYVLQHIDYAIAGNTEAQSVLRAKNYRGPTSVIPQFGIDPKLFHPMPKLNSEPFRIGYAGGRLVVEKGVDILLRAVARLDGNWELRILGSGPERANLSALANQLGIASRVIFDAPRSSVEMPAYLAQLDVVVLPSRTRPNWKEQFGRILVEAMACEIPVIGSTCGEIPNVTGDAGLTFPEENVDALCEQIARLRANPAYRAELGKRGRERAMTCFTQTQIAEETYKVYSSVVG